MPPNVSTAATSSKDLLVSISLSFDEPAQQHGNTPDMNGILTGPAFIHSEGRANLSPVLPRQNLPIRNLSSSESEPCLQHVFDEGEFFQKIAESLDQLDIRKLRNGRYV